MSAGRFLLKPFLGKRQFQSLFENMYKVGLAGMNVGEGGMPKQSGEPWVLNFISSQLKGQEPLVFDVGANVGQFAQAVLDRFPPEVRLWSFEPCAASFTSLQQKFVNRTNLTLVKAAVGSKEGEAEIFSPAVGSKLASFYDRSSTWTNASKEVVAVNTIDTYCARNGISAIDFLKIDVEGHELEVLRGADRMLNGGHIGFIQFEFSAAHIDARVFFRDFYHLLNDRYEICRILQNGLAPVKEYKPELELFKRATNYLAVKRRVDHKRSMQSVSSKIYASR